MTRSSLLACLTLLAAAVPAQAQEAFVWGDDLTVARKLAKEEGRPLLVVFR